MIPHMHTTLVEGCFRCDLNRDEAEDQREPEEGSVVLVHGYTGTAWQRHYSDGLWHSTTGLAVTWEALLTIDPVRRPILIHQP